MRKNITRILFCIIFTAALILSACSGNANSSQNDSTKDSAQTSDNEVKNNTSDSETEEKVLATDFEVTLVGGDTVKLSDYLGQKVLVNFWATWCGPCVQEMPAFQRLSEDYPDDVVILAVNCGDSAKDVEDFVQENGYTFNIAIDESLAVSSLYPTSSIPLTLIVDEEGYITYASYGAADADTMYEHYKEELGL